MTFVSVVDELGPPNESYRFMNRRGGFAGNTDVSDRFYCNVAAIAYAPDMLDSVGDTFQHGFVFIYVLGTNPRCTPHLFFDAQGRLEMVKSNHQNRKEYETRLLPPQAPE